MKIIACVGLVVLVLLVLFAVSMYFYNIAIKRADKSFLAHNPDLELAPMENKVVWKEEPRIEEVTLTSEDGLKLQGYWIEAKKPTDRIAIVAHGYSGKARDMDTFAKLFHEEFGYHVLMPDARGHGRSQGVCICFGWRERKDYVQWIDYMIRTRGPQSQIVLHGVSMGGATVCMTSGETLPLNVKAVISDCAYTSVHAQLAYQLKRMYKLPAFPLLYSTSLLARLRAGYSFKEASALEQVKKSRTPMLFIHGEDDTFVPFFMVKELYEACGCERELYTVPEAGHGLAFIVDPPGYKKHVKEFLSKYVR
ncbi:alpha/beta hydrolase [Paenibacillus solisilvae]|uniref:Alpha/beta hydrolase n=1 Tax=Paenibacillus solisilvae TaxID=2486751 RepID=A0ABW0W3E1_9BACL